MRETPTGSIAGQSKVTKWLSGQNGVVLTIYTIIAAFCTYSCMYAFRKAFAAADFEADPKILGLGFKSLLVISQTIGYALSKFMGIKVISEMGKGSRALAIVILIGIAELALLGFGLVPVQYKFVFMFLNGIPLGMVWGLVFSFLEGRRYTEVMGAGLCTSFVLASAFAKNIGGKLLEGNLIKGHPVSEFWMPFVTGLIFTIPLIFFVWMLSQVPEPTEEDIQLRTKREPMNSQQRWAFFKTFAAGLILLIITYVILSAFRDFRDNFMKEIIKGTHLGTDPKIFTQTETPVMLIVTLFLGVIMIIRNNRTALLVNHLFIFAGLATAGISTWLYQAGMISPFNWIVLTGVATYTAYVPFNCILFERMIATFKYVGTAGFLIYVADSFGYLGSVGVLFYKNFGQKNLDWVPFFINFNYILCFGGSIFVLLSLIYFARKKVTQQVITS